jgi:hypothetical protein
VRIATESDLVATLRGEPDLFESRARLGLLAAQGPEILPWLRTIVSDDGQPDLVRANALGVLALLLDSASVPGIVTLARDPGPLRAPALNALLWFPYPEACAFWRGVLREPTGKGAAVGVALGGIRFCGTPADIPLVESVLRWDRTFGAREVAERTIARLREPLAERYRGTQLEGNYPPSGTYRAPPEVAAEIGAQVCGGSCPIGLVIEPDAVARLRRP